MSAAVALALSRRPGRVGTSTEDAAVEGGATAAAGACSLYLSPAAAPFCHQAGGYVMGKVILPVASKIYDGVVSIFGGGDDDDPERMEQMRQAYEAAAASLREKLSPLFLPDQQHRVEALIKWYLTDSLFDFFNEHKPSPLDSHGWNRYRDKREKYTAPGGQHDQEFAAKIAVALGEQKDATGYSPKLPDGLVPGADVNAPPPSPAPAGMSTAGKVALVALVAAAGVAAWRYKTKGKIL